MAIKYNAKGLIVALDQKYTGTEPTWENANKESYEELSAKKVKALGFYAYYAEPSDTKEWLLQYMNANDFPSEFIDFIKKAPPTFMPGTLGKIARMLMLGMPNVIAPSDWKKKHPGIEPPTHSAFIYQDVKNAINAAHMRAGQTPVVPETKKKVSLKIDPKVKAQRDLKSKIFEHLEEYLDEIIQIDPKKKIPNFDVAALYSQENLPKDGIDQVIEYCQSKLDEFNEIGKDPEITEGYEYLSKKHVRQIKASFEKMIEDLKHLKKTKPASNKASSAGIKKRKSPAAQVAKMTEYLKESDEYGKSVPPMRIPGSSDVFLFTPHTRKLTYMKCRGGAEVRGKSVYGWDEKLSWTRTLRKPLDTLEVLRNGSKSEINAHLKTLTTKPGKVQNRVGAKTMIIRTL